MSVFVPVSVLLLGILIGIFLYYPTPQLTKNLTDWKDKGQFIDFKGHKVFYIDFAGTSSAGTVICLHGFPSSSYDWKKIIYGLKEKFRRVVVFDFLGFGFSDKSIDHNYTITEQADISVFLLEYLEERKVHILSHDYGDTVALELLARYNKDGKIGNGIKIETLSMLNGGIFQETHHPRLLQKILLYPVIGPVLAKLTFYQLFKRGFAEIFGTSKPSSEEMWEFWVCLRYNDGNSALSSIIEFLPERKKYKERWVGALKSTKISVQMIYGPADPVNPPAFVSYFRKEVPQHNLVELDKGVGHYPQWEKPEDVVRAYHTFIDENVAK